MPHRQHAEMAKPDVWQLSYEEHNNQLCFGVNILSFDHPVDFKMLQISKWIRIFLFLIMDQKTVSIATILYSFYVEYLGVQSLPNKMINNSLALSRNAVKDILQ